MRPLRPQARIAAAKLAVFTVVSVLFATVLIAIMGRFGGGDSTEYKALFTDASLIDSGDDVRIAGIVRGKVEDVERVDDSRALVTFSVSSDVELTTTTKAEIRYLDLVGGRYMALMPGGGNGEPLAANETIDVKNTRPALNLSAVFNGFAPLFAALSPDEVNELTGNIVEVLQGEGGTVQQLLSHTASLTTTIADREQLVGAVITNLNGVLATVDSRHGQLSELITELTEWTADLAEDRHEIGRSIDSIASAADLIAQLVQEGRPVLRRDVAELRDLVGELSRSDSKDLIVQILNRLPAFYRDTTKIGSYGSFYNYYLCGASVSIRLPRVLANLPTLRGLVDQLHQFSFDSTAPRCN